MSPLTLILKIPKVKMQVTASQIVQVEMVLDSSLFIVAPGFVMRLKL